MKTILILGAGKSSPYLISYLLDHAEEYDWRVIVADQDEQLALSRINNHPRGTAMSFDVTDSEARSQQISGAKVVINMLAPRFQHLVGLTCARFGVHMISVSYQDQRMRELETDAKKKGVLLLTEIGLDPGIDHMSAAQLIRRINERGGIVKSFQSYGGGLPAPDTLSNPFKYVISWNPRNVVMAGENGAQYLEDCKIKLIPYHNVFQHTWNMNVPGIGQMEAYPNRDSLIYQEQYGFKDAETVIRGTLRYPGWSETWYYIVRLGLPNEKLRIPGLKDKTFAELTEMLLPSGGPESGPIERRVAKFLQISPTGHIIEKMRWLGLFSDEKIGVEVNTSAEVLTQLISEKLALHSDARDMVVLLHQIIAEYPQEDNRREKITSTMIHFGEKAGFTSMAKSVGLPAALVAKLLLTEKISLTGCHMPTHPEIYEPVMKELEEEGFGFTDKTEQI